MRLQSFIFDKNCKNIAYILGYLWADGWMEYKNNSSLAVSLEIISEDFKDILPIIEKLDIQCFYYDRERKNRKPQSSVRFSDINFVNFLVENDYIDRRLKGFSKILSNFSNESKCYFIKGLYDGDGCFYLRNSICQITLSSALDQNYDGLSNIFDDLNMKFSIQKVENTNSYSALRITSKYSCKIFIDILKDSISYGLKRKNDKIKNIIEHIYKKNK